MLYYQYSRKSKGCMHFMYFWISCFIYYAVSNKIWTLISLYKFFHVFRISFFQVVINATHTISDAKDKINTSQSRQESKSSRAQYVWKVFKWLHFRQGPLHFHFILSPASYTATLTRVSTYIYTLTMVNFVWF